MKAIEYWKTIPEDAVDSKTGKPLEPKEQIEACNHFIERYRQDIAYWEQLNSAFYDFAQRGLKKEYQPCDNQDMFVCLGRWWSLMIRFARRLAALTLSFGIKLMDIQEECAIYLTHHFLITDYVDDKYISSIEQAQALLDKALVIKQSYNANTINRFENVLKIIYDDYTALESLTNDKDSLGEEALRNHAVAALKTHGYTASAESLNLMRMTTNAKSTSTGWAVSLTPSSSTSTNYRTAWTISSGSLVRPDGGSTIGNNQCLVTRASALQFLVI